MEATDKSANTVCARENKKKIYLKFFFLIKKKKRINKRIRADTDAFPIVYFHKIIDNYRETEINFNSKGATLVLLRL